MMFFEEQIYMKYKEIGRYFLYICKKETFYIYVYIYLGQIGYDGMVVMMNYRPTAVFGWFAIRDGHMKSADIGLVVGTAIWVKVERRSSGLVGQQCG